MAVAVSGAHAPGTVRCGAVPKPELLELLVNAGVQLNDYARALFDSELFVTSPDEFAVDVVQTSPDELGLAVRATLPAILEAAAARGLRPCPVELGPHLRLQYLGQPASEGARIESTHRAPLGALTVVSIPLLDDDDFPKGFYLRSIDGNPWLRGYCCSMAYEWERSDRLLFRMD